MDIADIVALISEIGVLLGVVTPLIVVMRKICNGVRGQLRSDMLRIYYAHKDTGIIRQYEIENFLLLYEAYKALKGNGFIEKVYKEVMTWEVVT